MTRKQLKRLMALLLGSVVGAAAPAVAADIAVKVQPALPVAYDAFSGPYLGINFGYGWNLGTSADAFRAVPFADLKASPQGVLGGFQLGYGARVNQWLYLGLEGDADIAAMTGTSSIPGLITTISKDTWMASVRADVGVIPVGHALFYGTVGWGFGSGEFTVTDVTGNTASLSPTQNGLAWGGGFKVPLSANWVVDVKYLQYDFGDVTVTNANQFSFTTRDRIDVVRAGLNYKF